MGFGNLNNVARSPQSGFNPTRMFSGFNLGNGVRSQFASWLAYEFKYTDVFAFLVRASNTLITFDWNASDKELRAKYKEMNENLAGAWGAVFGRGLGSAAAIGIGGATALMLPKIGSGSLARTILKEASLEAREELLDEVVDALRETRLSAGSMLALEGFIRYRQIMKSDLIPEAFLASIYGQQTASFIKRGWGEENGETFVIAQKIDERIEGIKNSVVQEFIREAIDGFGDAFIDTGFVIAQGFDDALRQYQLARTRTEEAPVIEVYPYAENPDEVYIVESDTQVDIEEEIQAILNTHRVMQSRDVGRIVAQSVESYRNTPIIRKLEITFRPIKRPPFMYPNGDEAEDKQLTIPEVKRGLTWNKIKRAFGNGNVAYVLGDRTATQKFDGVNRFLRVNISDSEVGGIEAKLKDWASLSELTPRRGITISDVQNQSSSQRVSPMPMYATTGKLIKSNILPNGRLSRQPPEEYRFNLWTEDEPEEFREKFTWL